MYANEVETKITWDKKLSTTSIWTENVVLQGFRLNNYFRYKSLHSDPRQEMKENLQSSTLENNDFGEKKFQCSVD